MVPSFATAHIFCASGYGPGDLNWSMLSAVPINSKVFFTQFMTMRGNKILASVIEIQGVTTNFSEIIKLQFGKYFHTFLMYFKAF